MSAVRLYFAGMVLKQLRALTQLDIQLFLVVLVAAGYTLFCGPGRYPIQLWDESRLAVNATEMVLNHQLLVTYFDGQPDLWNTKPPLLIWLQAGCIAVLGNKEWVVRLPTSTANLVTVSVLYWFCARPLRSPAAGLFSGLVLATCAGFASYHVAWAADYDALLCMWQVLVLVAFFQYTEHRTRTAWWVCVGALMGGVLTKGIAGFICVPALVAYGLWRGALLPLFGQRKFYAALLLFGLAVGGFYLARELAAPGYWRAVQENELQGRFSRAFNYLHGPWNFYLDHLRHGDFWPWLGVPPTLLLAWLQPEARPRRLTVWLLTYSGVWLAVLSLSASKAFWYAAPVFPALALLVGLGLSWVYEALRAPFFATRLSSRTSVLLFAALVFWYPYRVIAAVVNQRSTFAENKYVTYLTNLVVAHPEIKRVTLLVPRIFQDPQPVPNTPHDPDSNYNPVYSYYRLAFKMQHRLDVAFLNNRQLNRLQPADTVVVCLAPLRQELTRQFVVRILGGDAQGCTVVIVSRRE